jgi:hypothetical protein
VPTLHSVYSKVASADVPAALRHQSCALSHGQAKRQAQAKMRHMEPGLSGHHPRTTIALTRIRSPVTLRRYFSPGPWQPFLPALTTAKVPDKYGYFFPILLVSMRRWGIRPAHLPRSSVSAEYSKPIPRSARFLQKRSRSILSEVHMTAATQIATVRRLPAVSDDRAILPKRDTLVHQPEAIVAAYARVRNQFSLPIFVLGLGVALTLAWMGFLAWEAAIIIVTMVM